MYSQQLEKHVVENTCKTCNKHFPQWGKYHAHVIAKACERQENAFKSLPKDIKPIKTSTRSKAQIVFDMEKTWGHAVIPMVQPWQALGDK